MKKDSKDKKKSSLKGLSIISKLTMLAITASMLAISLYAFLLLLMGMLPGIVALFTDRRAGRFASGTISFFNFIGLAPYLSKILTSPTPDIIAQNMIVEPFMWLIIYSAAGIGWIMLWLMPQLGVAVLVTRADMIINKSKTAQRALIDEWGPDIAKESKRTV